jgi:hypothetical protein
MGIPHPVSWCSCWLWARWRRKYAEKLSRRPNKTHYSEFCTNSEKKQICSIFLYAIQNALMNKYCCWQWFSTWFMERSMSKGTERLPASGLQVEARNLGSHGLHGRPSPLSTRLVMSRSLLLKKRSRPLTSAAYNPFKSRTIAGESGGVDAGVQNNPAGV